MAWLSACAKSGVSSRLICQNVWCRQCTCWGVMSAVGWRLLCWLVVAFSRSRETKSLGIFLRLRYGGSSVVPSISLNACWSSSVPMGRRFFLASIAALYGPSAGFPSALLKWWRERCFSFLARLISLPTSFTSSGLCVLYSWSSCLIASSESPAIAVHSSARLVNAYFTAACGFFHHHLRVGVLSVMRIVVVAH